MNTMKFFVATVVGALIALSLPSSAQNVYQNAQIKLPVTTGDGVVIDSTGKYLLDLGAAPAPIPSVSTTISTNTTISPTSYDYMVPCNATSGNVAITFPVTKAGQLITVIKIDSSTNTCIEQFNGTDKADGATNITETAQWQSATLEGTGITSSTYSWVIR